MGPHNGIEGKTVVYEKWKSITDKLYSGELLAKDGAKQLIELLAENGIRLRSNRQSLITISFFVYDKSEWRAKGEKPLCLGFVYRKPNSSKTQDIFIVRPNGQIEKYYREREMVKMYPWMKGTHKKDLPV